MLVNTANLNALFTGYNASFKNAFKMAEPDWAKIATLSPSTTEINLYAFLGQFPALRQWLGSRIVKDMKANSYSLTNLDFEVTVGVPRNKIEDDTFGTFSTFFADMGYSAKLHPDELIFAKVLSGATDLCYDDQPFFNASHPVITDGVAATVSNYDVTGGGAMWVLLDTRRPLKPFIWQKRKDYNFQAFNKPGDEHVFMNKEFLYGVDARGAAGYGLWQMAYASLNTLNAANFDAAVTAMMSLKSDEGKPLGIRPNLLLCGTSNRAAARNLIDTQKLASGADNPNFKEVEVLVSPQMT